MKKGNVILMIFLLLLISAIAVHAFDINIKHDSGEEPEETQTGSPSEDSDSSSDLEEEKVADWTLQRGRELTSAETEALIKTMSEGFGETFYSGLVYDLSSEYPFYLLVPYGYTEWQDVFAYQSDFVDGSSANPIDESYANYGLYFYSTTSYFIVITTTQEVQASDLKVYNFTCDVTKLSYSDVDIDVIDDVSSVMFGCSGGSGIQINQSALRESMIYKVKINGTQVPSVVEICDSANTAMSLRIHYCAEDGTVYFIIYPLIAGYDDLGRYISFSGLTFTDAEVQMASLPAIS